MDMNFETDDEESVSNSEVEDLSKDDDPNTRHMVEL